MFRFFPRHRAGNMANGFMRDFFDSEPVMEVAKLTSNFTSKLPTIPKPTKPTKPTKPGETDPETGKPIKSPCRKSIAIDGASAESCCDRGLLKAEQAINLVEGAARLMHELDGVLLPELNEKAKAVREHIENNDFSTFDLPGRNEAGVITLPTGPTTTIIRSLPRIIPFVPPVGSPAGDQFPAEPNELPNGDLQILLPNRWAGSRAGEVSVLLQLATAAKRKVRKMQQQGFCCDCIGEKSMSQASKAVTVAEACIQKHGPGRPKKGEQRKVQPCNLDPKKQRTRAGKCAEPKPIIPTKPPTRPTYPGPGKPTLPPGKPPTKPTIPTKPPTRPTYPGPGKPKVQAKGKVAAPVARKGAKVQPKKRRAVKSKTKRKK